MKYWLVKSEPDVWSWDDQCKAKNQTTHWDGVRNAQASNNLKAMSKGDRCLFYHSNKERAVVGIVEVVKEFYPDPGDESGRFGMVDVKAVEPLKNPVTLKQIKAEPAFEQLALVRQPRLSVMPVDAKSFKQIIRMSG
ncbi:EVE domain-containing protein [Phycisphaerales bacterium AB-hyl4]|uniref:EVE domain-containing protein n=1 Tax=Natronomicrosphaera hydrolytica TaxID=3242702 RepID=A0ABV4U5W3_9BACT